MSFFGNAYVLLFLTALFWAGNAIAGQLAVGEVSPFALVFLRWLLVSVSLLAFYHRQLIRAWPILRQHWLLIALMSVLGFTFFNALFYVASHRTTAVNIGILQGSIPIFVFTGAYFIYKTRASGLQIAGTLVTLLGVVWVTTRGDLDVLMGLEFARGDLIMLLACSFYASYTIMLQKRPEVPGIVLFTLMSVIAAMTSLPLIAFDTVSGDILWPGTAKAWGTVLYIAVFPSCLSQLFFMRGVEALGPGRAGVFVNLVPVFTAMLAVVILAEPFRFYHGASMTLVLAGIWLAERGRARSR